MLEQNLRLSLVLVITVLLSIFLNNTFILGEFLSRMPQVGVYISPLVKRIIISAIGIFSYIALVPFNYGRDIWFYENARKNRLSPVKLFSFYGVRKSFGAIKITLAVQVRKFIITLLFLTPSLTVGGYIFFALRQGIGQLIFIALTVSLVVLGITGVFFAFVFCQRYFLAPYLYFENEPCKANEIVNLSCKIMDKKCFETAMLKLSFFPWWLLCILVFPAIYVYPYYKLSISFKAITILTNNT